jgi:hypothetical protein
MNRVLFCLGLGAASIALVVGGQEGAIAQPDSIFRPIVSSLKDQLPQGWKLRLPSSIQVRDYENKPIVLYAKSDGFSNGSLRVSLDTQSDCTARACQIGSIFVERGSSFLGSLKSDPIFSKSDIEKVRAVRARNYQTRTEADRQLMLRAEGAVLERSIVDLSPQIKGTFIHRNAMGVSTGPSIIVTWNQDGQIYTISLRGGGGGKQAIVAAAKSMAKENPIGEVEVADNRSSQANGQKGAVNLGGSSYFSWGLLKPESRDNNQSQIVMGYGCQTQNQLEGISQRASVSRYVIKRGRGSDDWWLESLGGVVVRPTPNGYVSEKVEGISSSELKRYVTDASSGFLKRDMDVDGLGNACINGGIQGALNYIQGSGSNKPIAQPPKPPSNGYSEKEFVQSWSNVNPALKPFLGTWLEPEGNIRIYPATVKDRVCLVVNASGQVIVDIGTVTNGQIAKLSEGGGPYISRRGKPGEQSWTGEPENKELLVNVNPKGNLVAWRFLNRDTTSIKVQHPSQELQGLPQEIVRGRSGEIQKFDKAGCTTGLPQGSIAKPIEPLTPIAASNTYAYPSPQEFAQFKKTLKPAPVGLSAADRKLRQDFQTEWQKKNPAIGPYVGAWKTADNQDIYVFPSSQAGRACVVEKKDGEFKAAIGVSMTADMRYSLTHGQFRVAGMTDVVAGRSDKSQPLSALYAAIGSPDVSSSVKEDLAQAKCVAELPKGGAIVAQKAPGGKPIEILKPVAKPIETPKPIDKLIRSGAAPDTPIDLGACVKGNPYQSTREFLLKCLSGNRWGEHKRDDLRGYNTGEKGLAFLNYEEKRMADSTSTIKMRLINTLGSAGVVEVYGRDNKLKNIYFIDEHLPGDSVGKFFVEGASKIWNFFVQGDSMDINGTRTELIIDNVDNSDVIKVSSHTPASKLYNDILSYIEIMDIASGLFDLKTGSDHLKPDPLGKTHLAQKIAKEMVKGLPVDLLKSVSLEFSGETSAFLTQVQGKDPKNFRDLLKGKVWISRVFLLYQEARSNGLEKVGEKLPDLLKSATSTTIDTSIESTLKAFGLEGLVSVLKLSSGAAGSINLINRINSSYKSYSESPIVLSDFSMKYYMRDSVEYEIDKIITHKIFSDGTKMKVKEIPREAPPYIEEWIMEGSTRVKTRRYRDGTIEKVESSFQGTGQ